MIAAPAHAAGNAPGPAQDGPFVEWITVVDTFGPVDLMRARPLCSLDTPCTGPSLWGPPLAPVPLPASVWLLLAALGGLAFAAWALSSRRPVPPQIEPQKAEAPIRPIPSASARQPEGPSARVLQGEHRGPIETMPAWEWLHYAAMRLIEIWPGMEYDHALRELKDFAADQLADWPDGGFVWNIASAKELAEEYARDYGESYGANS